MALYPSFSLGAVPAHRLAADTVCGQRSRIFPQGLGTHRCSSTAQSLLASPLAMAGLVLAAYGCTGLLLKRLLDPALRSVTSRGDFFGLFLILATVLCWLLSWGLFDRSLAGATGYFRELARFCTGLRRKPLHDSGSVLLSVFLVYMPFTYMVHAYAKYFIYHKVVWQDEPMAPGSEMERRIEQMLREPVGWSASHINKGASWSTTISSPPQQHADLPAAGVR